MQLVTVNYSRRRFCFYRSCASKAGMIFIYASPNRSKVCVMVDFHLRVNLNATHHESSNLHLLPLHNFSIEESNTTTISRYCSHRLFMVPRPTFAGVGNPGERSKQHHKNSLYLSVLNLLSKTQSMNNAIACGLSCGKQSYFLIAIRIKCIRDLKARLPTIVAYHALTCDLKLLILLSTPLPPWAAIYKIIYLASLSLQNNRQNTPNIRVSVSF